MNSENQKLIHAARAIVFKSKIQHLREKKELKIQSERAHAEAEILLDDLAAEGVDVNTKEGRAVLQVCLARKLANTEGGSGYRAAFNLDGDL